MNERNYVDTSYSLQIVYRCTTQCKTIFTADFIRSILAYES